MDRIDAGLIASLGVLWIGTELVGPTTGLSMFFASVVGVYEFASDHGGASE